MKKCSIYNIKGGEVLANPIMTSSYQVILSEGTVLRREYIENFIELGITDVYIYEDNIDKTKGEVKSAKKEEKKENDEEKLPRYRSASMWSVHLTQICEDNSIAT